MIESSAHVFCPECGAMRVRRRRSPYAVCPNGHGKLVPRFTKADVRQAIVTTIPRARRVGRNRFQIKGHKGLFCYRGGSGRRRAEPGMPLRPDELIARHRTRKRQLIRVFTRKVTAPRRTSRRDGDS